MIGSDFFSTASGIQDKIFNLEEVSYGASSSAISIDGFADSRVAQGMLALLIEVLSFLLIVALNITVYYI